MQELPGFPFVKGVMNFIARDEALSKTWGSRFGRIFANLRKKCILREYTPYKTINVVIPYLNNVTGSLTSTNQHHTFAFVLRDEWLQLRAVVDFAIEIFKESLFQDSIGLLNTACANDQEFAGEHAAFLAFNSP